MAVDWSRINTDELEPEFYDDVNGLLVKQKHMWVVTEGFRSQDRSNELFVNYKLNKGVRAAPGGLSPHNYRMAVDVALDGNDIRPGVQAVWDVTHPAWVRLVADIWKHKRLRSGKWYSDWPHIEKLKWKDYVAWRHDYEANVRYLRNIAGMSRFV
jgi:hypothetical protein